jgi:hypothetical protein
VREIPFIVASRYEPDFIALRQRLANAGKPPKVIRIALAHKLLVRLNPKAREGRQRIRTASGPRAATFPQPLDRTSSSRDCGKAENSSTVFRGALAPCFP